MIPFGKNCLSFSMQLLWEVHTGFFSHDGHCDPAIYPCSTRRCYRDGLVICHTLPQCNRHDTMQRSRYNGHDTSEGHDVMVMILCLMESTRWNLFNGSARWNLPNKICSMESARWNLLDGICSMESARWNLLNGIYSMGSA